jgi:tRNA pseudouridine38-40 synthase
MKKKPPIAAYRLLLEYEGTKFHGWQRQDVSQGTRTVAGSIEHAAHKAGLRIVTLMGSGRTDAGVHALGQVAHLHLEAGKAPDPRELPRILEPFLPSDIGLREVHACSPDFHARHDAGPRTYLYQLSRRRSGLAKPFIWWMKQSFDLDRLVEAWTSFVGFQDISAFADLDHDDDPRCEIQRCEWACTGSLVLLRVTASHFKRSQVRRMVGASVAIAVGRHKQADLQRDLKRPRPESALRWSDCAAAASGLFLEHVEYPGGHPLGPLRPVIEVP